MVIINKNSNIFAKNDDVFLIVPFSNSTSLPNTLIYLTSCAITNVLCLNTFKMHKLRFVNKGFDYTKVICQNNFAIVTLSLQW